MQVDFQIIENKIKFYEYKNPISFNVVDQTDIWLFYNDHIEVWDMISKKIAFYKNHDYIAKSPLFIYLSKYTVAYISNKKSKRFLQKYNIKRGVNQVLATIKHQNWLNLSNVCYGCFFSKIKTLAFVLNNRKLNNVFIWGLKRNQQKNQLFSFQQFSLSLIVKKYDQFGTFSIIDSNKGFFKLSLNKQQKIYNMKRGQTKIQIISVSKKSDSEALILVDNITFTQVICLNINTSTKLQIIQLKYKLNKLVCYQNQWIVVEAINKVDISKDKNKQSFLRICIFSQTNYKWCEIKVQGANLPSQEVPILMKKRTGSEFSFKTIKIVNKKYHIIHLLQESGISSLFGNQIVKEVINSYIQKSI